MIKESAPGGVGALADGRGVHGVRGGAGRRAPGARVSRALRGEARSLCGRPCAGMQKGALSACVLTATAGSERGAGVDSKRARPRSKWGQAAPGAGSTNAQPLDARAGQHVPSMRSALPLARESLPEGVAS